MVASPDNVCRADITAFGQRTPPFLHQIDVHERLGGSLVPLGCQHEYLRPGVCESWSRCGSLRPRPDAHNRRFAAETGSFADRWVEWFRPGICILLISIRIRRPRPHSVRDWRGWRTWPHAGCSSPRPHFVRGWRACGHYWSRSSRGSKKRRGRPLWRPVKRGAVGFLSYSCTVRLLWR